METTRETLLKVQGMTCGSCVRHVGGAIQALDGVKDVVVNLAAATVTVTHAPERPDVAELVATLLQAGYPAAPAFESKAAVVGSRKSSCCCAR